MYARDTGKTDHSWSADDSAKEDGAFPVLRPHNLDGASISTPTFSGMPRGILFTALYDSLWHVVTIRMGAKRASILTRK